MKGLALFLALLLPLLTKAGAAVVVIQRGNQPNIFPVAPPNPVEEAFDINSDGVDDFLFFRGGFVAGIRGYGVNRVISTLATAPDQGTYASPVSLGSILGSDTANLLGDWHHHTDNVSNPNLGFTYTSLSQMQVADAYIGLEFTSDLGTHYGWVHYIGFSSPESGTPLDVLGGFINSWAYETQSGVSIAAGIPEPSNGILILIGSAICLGSRTRR